MLNYVPSWWPILMIFFSDTTWRIELKCHEWSLQAANQVLLLFGPIENPRWPPVGDIGRQLYL
jgi:hypothetical protein